MTQGSRHITASGRRGERGLALPAALWLGVLVAAIGGALALLAGADARLAEARLQKAQAAALAESAARLAAFRLAEQDPRYLRAAAEGGPRLRISALGGEALVTIRPETAFLDLNAAAPPEIAAMLVEIGAEPQQAASMAAAIADFIDADDLARLNGAEADAYRAAGLSYGPRNGPLRHPGELALVLGVDRRTAAAALERSTIYAERPGPLFIPDFETVFGRGVARDALAALASAGATAEPSRAAPGGGARAYRIAAEARLPSGAAARARLVAAPNPRRAPPFQVLGREVE